MKSSSIVAFAMLQVVLLATVCNAALHPQLHHPAALPLSTIRTKKKVSSNFHSFAALGERGQQENRDDMWCEDLLSMDENDRQTFVTKTLPKTYQTDMFILKLRLPVAPNGGAFAALKKHGEAVGFTVAHFGTASLMVHVESNQAAVELAKLLHDGNSDMNEDKLRNHFSLVCPLHWEHKVHSDLLNQEEMAKKKKRVFSAEGATSTSQDSVEKVMSLGEPGNHVCVKALGILPANQKIAASRAQAHRKIKRWEYFDNFGNRRDHFAINTCCGANGHWNVTNCVKDVAKRMAITEGVYFVEQYTTKATLHNKFSRGIMQSGHMYEEPLAAAGIEGKGQIIGVADTGIDHDHCFFYDPNHPNINYDVAMPTHRKIVRYARVESNSQYSRSDYKEGHGTHVAGSVAGVALDETMKNANFHGVAPSAKISFMDMSSLDQEGIALPPTAGQLFRPALNDGARIHSNSWGSQRSIYSSMSAEVDAFVASQEDFLVVFSAGNEADKACGDNWDDVRCDRFTVNAPSTNKNGLSVGASMAPLVSWEMASYGNFLLKVTPGTEGTKLWSTARADFGPKTVPPEMGDVSMIFAVPTDACHTITNDISGKIAIVWRGVCHFEEKAKRLQSLGAVAMVVVNNEPGDPFTMGSTQDSHSGEKGVIIPSFMISEDKGNKLKEWLEAKIDVLGKLESSSAPDPKKDEENLSSFSSHGPTSDYRYKPDLLSVGEFVHSAYSDANLGTKNCDLWPSMGTSMSCPLISGTAALVREYFLRGFHAEGHEDPTKAITPSAALLKATLIHSSRALTGQFDRNTHGDWHHLNPTPSFEQGHGIVNLNSSLPMGKDAKLKLYLDQDASLATQQERTYCVHFNGNGEEPFKAVLAWTDPASSPASHFHLINNLDLEVVAPPKTEGGPQDIYRGNQHYPNTPEADVLNNLEKVTIPNAPSGTYLVRVKAVTVVSASQKFAIVASGVEKQDQAQCNVAQCVHGTPQPDQDEFCVCHAGWVGVKCDIPLNTMSQGESATIFRLMPMEWRYFRVNASTLGTSAAKKFMLTVTNSLPDSDVDIYVYKGDGSTLGTLVSAYSGLPVVAKNTDCDNCGVTAKSSMKAKTMKVEFKPSKPTETDFIIGVVAMCCFNTTVRLHLTGYPTATSSVLGITKSSTKASGHVPSRLLVHMPVTEPLSVRIKGIFPSTATPSTTIASFGEVTRREHPCEVKTISTTELVCVINDLSQYTSFTILSFRLEIDGVVSTPATTTVAVWVTTGNAVPTSPPTSAPPVNQQRRSMVIGVTSCSVMNALCTEKEQGHVVVLPPTVVDHGAHLYFLAPANATSVEKATVQSIELIAVGSNEGVQCRVKAVLGQLIPCSIPNHKLVAGHQYTLVVHYKDNVIEPKEPSVASVRVEEPTFANKVVMMTQIEAENVVNTINEPKTIETLRSTGTDRLTVGSALANSAASLFFIGGGFIPTLNQAEGVIASKEWSYPVVGVVGSVHCDSTVALADYVVECKLSAGHNFELNHPIDVSIVAPMYNAMPALAVTFTAAAHATRIVGTHDAEKDVTVVPSLTLTIMGQNFHQGAVITVSLDGAGETAHCKLLRVTSDKLVCQVDGDFGRSLPRLADAIILVTVQFGTDVVLDKARIMLQANSMVIVGVGAGRFDDPTQQSTTLPEATGDFSHPVGPTLYLFGEFLPTNISGWSILLMGTNSPYNYDCMPRNNTMEYIACEANPYAYGQLELRVLDGEGLPVPLRPATMLVTFQANSMTDVQKDSRYLITGEPLFYGAKSTIEAEMYHNLPGNIVLSTTGCGRRTLMKQYKNLYRSAFTEKGKVQPMEYRDSVSVCAALYRHMEVNEFYFEILPRLPVWYVSTLTLGQSDRKDLLFNQVSRSVHKPPEGYNATAIAVTAKSTLEVSLTIEHYGTPGQPSQNTMEFAFAFTTAPLCEDDLLAYEQPVIVNRPSDDIVSVSRANVKLPNSLLGRTTLCAVVRQAGQSKSAPIALASLRVAECVSREDCNGHGSCIEDEDGTPRCKCLPGFGGQSCNNMCPSVLSQTVPDPVICGDFGNCDTTDGTCTCNEAYLGDACLYRRNKLSLEFSSTFPPMQQFTASVHSRRIDRVELPNDGTPLTPPHPLLVFEFTGPEGLTEYESYFLDILVSTTGAMSGDVHEGKSVPVFVDVMLWDDPKKVGSELDATALVVAPESTGEGQHVIQTISLKDPHCRTGRSCFVGLFFSPADPTFTPQYFTKVTDKGYRTLVVKTAFTIRKHFDDPISQPNDKTGLPASSAAAPASSSSDDEACDSACVVGGVVVSFAALLGVIIVAACVSVVVSYCQRRKESQAFFANRDAGVPEMRATRVEYA